MISYQTFPSWPGCVPARHAAARVAVAIAVWCASAAGVVAMTAPLPYALAAGDLAFRVEWQRSDTARGPVMNGYVYNDAGLAAARVSLLVEALDRSGRPISSTIAYVPGTVPALSRAYFTSPVPAADSYRVSVRSFDWVKGGGV